MFLDPRLQNSSSLIVVLELCQVRLSHNSAFPWVLLIPQREEIKEIIDLNLPDQQRLMQEIGITSQVLKNLFHPDKLNIASLGNIVPQLHIHIIARYINDPAWPNPVWNTVSHPYSLVELDNRLKQLKKCFELVA